MVIGLAALVAKKGPGRREGNAPFECGFEPGGPARFPFSLRFFLITIIFLIFDVEITLLLPIPVTLKEDLKTLTPIAILFLALLTVGLYYEWWDGALEWAE